jgi:hypothetical protein
MSAPAHGVTDRAALKKLIADSGVKVTAEDVEAVARSLDRIQAAVAPFLQSLSFDETGERFYRLLNDAADGAGG